MTSRVEDTAYCLMSLFDVNMPLLYGEGKKAFERLQLAIIQTTDDESIFAWTDWEQKNSYSGIFAYSPSQFRYSGKITRILRLEIGLFETTRPPYSMTNQGLAIKVPSNLLPELSDNRLELPLNCQDSEKPLSNFNVKTIHLERGHYGPWYRIHSDKLGESSHQRVMDNDCCNEAIPAHRAGASASSISGTSHTTSFCVRGK